MDSPFLLDSRHAFDHPAVSSAGVHRITELADQQHPIPTRVVNHHRRHIPAVVAVAPDGAAHLSTELFESEIGPLDPDEAVVLQTRLPDVNSHEPGLPPCLRCPRPS